MSVAAVRRVVCRLAPDRPPTDAELVTAIAPPSADREAAFEILVERYGPMVLGVCRRVLADAHDAEDAFQAAFLVLARRSNTIRPPGAVGGWLYGVAVRTARKAKTAAARRRRREMTATTATTANPGRKAGGGEEVGGELQQTELRALIDAELAALPESHRAAVVLCDLHGKTRAEAAAELDRPEGTVAAWLSRGRKALAARLAKRGVVLPTAGLVAVAAPAVVSAKMRSTAFAALVGRTVSPTALALAESVMRSLTVGTTKLAAAVFAVGALMAAVATAGAWQFGEPQPQPIPLAAPADDPKPKAKPDMTAWQEKRVLELPGWLGGSVAYSAAGKWLFVGGTGGHVRAYDAATFKQLWEAKESEHFSVVAPSPGEPPFFVETDGIFVAQTVKEGVRLLDAATGKPGHLFKGDWSGEPMALAWFANKHTNNFNAPGVTERKFMFVNRAVHMVLSWNEGPGVTLTDSLKQTSQAYNVGRLKDEHSIALAVSSDGNGCVVTGPTNRETGKNYLRLWDAGSVIKSRTLEGHGAAVIAAAWSKDRSRLITGDAGGEVILWDTTTFTVKSRLKLGGRVAGLALTLDGKTAAAAVVSLPEVLSEPFYHEDVFVWPTAAPPAKPEPISRTPASGSFSGVASVAFRPDGRSLVSGFANFSHLARGGELVGRVRVFAAPPDKPAPLPPPVASVGFGPDGKYLVRRGDKASVYDETGTAINELLRTEAAQFVGNSTVASMGPESVAFFGLENWARPTKYARPKTKEAWNHVAFSPDGKRFAAHFGSHVRIYETATGTEVALGGQYEQAGRQRGGAVPALEFSADGQKLFASGVVINANGNVGAMVWDVTTGKGLLAIEPAANEPITAIAIAPNGKEVAHASGDRVVVFAFEGEKNPQLKFPTKDPVTALAYSADGKMLAVGLRVQSFDRWWADVREAYQGEVLLIEAATGKELRRLGGFKRDSVLLDGGKVQEPNEDNLRGSKGVWYDPLVVSMAFSPDGKKLLAATGLSHIDGLPVPGAPRGEVKMFDLTAPEPPKPAGRQWTDAAILTEHRDLVNGVAVNPDGSSFVAATDGAVVCWDMTTRKKLWEYKVGGPVYAIAYAGNGTVVATGAKATTLLDAKTGKAVAAPILQGRAQPARVLPGGRAAAFAPDPPRIAVSDGYAASVEYLPPLNGSVVLADPPANKEVPPVIAAGVAWSADGKRVAFVPHDRTAGKWAVVVADAFTGKPDRLLTGHDVRPACVAWSADGKLLVSGDEKGIVIAWEAGTGKELWRRQFRGRDDTDGRINALALSPADNTVAAAMSLGSGKGPERVVLLDGKTGRDVEHIMRPWSLAVTSVAWSKDGKYLVTGCGSYLGQPVPQDKELLGEVVVWERKPEP